MLGTVKNPLNALSPEHRYNDCISGLHLPKSILPSAEVAVSDPPSTSAPTATSASPPNPPQPHPWAT